MLFGLFKYLKPYWMATLLAPLFMFVEVTSDLLQPTLMARIVDEGIANGNMPFIITTGLQMVGIALMGLLGGLGCIAASSYAGVNMGTDLRSAVYKKIQQFSFANLDRFKAASLITRLTNDIVQVQMVVLMSLRMLVRAPLLCVGGLVMALSINPRLSLIFGITIPLLIVSHALIMKKSFPLFAVVQQKLDRVNAVIRENLIGVRVVKAFARMELENARFGTANEDLAEIAVRASRLIVLIMPLMMLIMNLSIVAVIWFGGIQVKRGDFQVGQVMAFINYMTIILFSLLMVGYILMMFSRAKASADRINEVLETEVDIKDVADASDAPIRNGSIAFENVTFKYKGDSGEPVLKNVSFSVAPGERVAILGETGSGKSTLVNLIPRLYDVTEGRVLVDGRDVRSIKLKTLREGIGIVPQESMLFSGTIKDNLRWGKKDATDDEVIAAAKAAQAHDFIMSFKDGYETHLGQRGVNISGGQKQRLAIARALVKRPPVLILDDSTSAVDAETEVKIHQALRMFLRDTTMIIITQRISPIMDADKILLLERGKIVAKGTHEELLRTSPVYRDICRSQLGEEEVELVR